MLCGEIIRGDPLSASTNSQSSCGHWAKHQAGRPGSLQKRRGIQVPVPIATPGSESVNTGPVDREGEGERGEEKEDHNTHTHTHTHTRKTLAGDPEAIPMTLDNMRSER
ncbi:hypothetical protein NHX12_006515, partial [Muraenolepis orangiensis]